MHLVDIATGCVHQTTTKRGCNTHLGETVSSPNGQSSICCWQVATDSTCVQTTDRELRQLLADDRCPKWNVVIAVQLPDESQADAIQPGTCRFDWRRRMPFVLRGRVLQRSKMERVSDRFNLGLILPASVRRWLRSDMVAATLPVQGKTSTYACQEMVGDHCPA